MTSARASLAGLLEQAERREPWMPDDTKSGARFERVVIDGRARSCSSTRTPGTTGCSARPGTRAVSYVRLWESGLLDRLPDVIDHAVVAAAYDGTVGIVLLRDVGEALLEPDAAVHARAARPLPRSHGRPACGVLGLARRRRPHAARQALPVVLADGGCGRGGPGHRGGGAPRSWLRAGRCLPEVVAQQWPPSCLPLLDTPPRSWRRARGRAPHPRPR